MISILAFLGSDVLTSTIAKINEIFEKIEGDFGIVNSLHHSLFSFYNFSLKPGGDHE